MKRIMVILSVLIMTGCAREGIKTEQTNNERFQITLLFEHEGCKVYRFYDGGYYRYYTVCGNDSEATYSIQSGKIRIHQSVPTTNH